MAQVQVRAEQLPDYIGRNVPGHGVLKHAAVVQPGGDIVVARFGEGFDRTEATFTPEQMITVETG
jgi:hypothetical protein